jgi:hypothetical protein
VGNLDNAFAPVQRQKGLGALGHPLRQVAIGEDGLQILPVGLAQAIG